MRAALLLSFVLVSSSLVLPSPVLAQFYTVSLSDQVVAYDPADGTGTFTIDVSFTEDPSSFGYPTATVAFGVYLANDTTHASLVAAEMSDAVAGVNGGAGPESFNFTVTDEYVGISVKYDDYYVTSLILDGPVLTLTYELNATTLAGDVDGAETEIGFHDTPGYLPWVFNELLEYVSQKDLEPAAIKFVPEAADPPGEHFLRGDADGNGVVAALQDAIYLFRYGFSGGAVPTCLDAADTDDNGSVAIIADCIRLLQWSFAGGAVPPAPGPEECGEDPTSDVLGCDSPPDACAP